MNEIIIGFSISHDNINETILNIKFIRNPAHIPIAE